MSSEAGRRVVVTGSCGRVGSCVASLLHDRGDYVVGVDIGTPPTSVPWRHVTVDLSDRDALERSLADADVVVHLAALMSWEPGDSDRLFSANVDATRAVVDWAVEHAVGRFVFASSGDVYPESFPIYTPVDEQHPALPRSTYGLTKLLGEEIVRHAERARDLPGVILRFEMTMSADELLNADSVSAGPRFFLQPRLRRETERSNQAMVDLLEPHARDGVERLILLRDENGRSARMPITDARDIAHGVALATEVPDCGGRTIGIGPAQATSFDEALPTMSAVTGLDLVEIQIPDPLQSYETSIELAQSVLGYFPKWDFERMLREAATSWPHT